MTATTTLEEHDTLPRPASPITSVALANHEIPAGRSFSSPAVPDNEGEWTTEELFDADAEEQVGIICRSCRLQKSCLVKRWKVPESIVGAVSLVVRLVDDAVIASSGPADVADPRIDELGESCSVPERESTL